MTWTHRPPFWLFAATLGYMLLPAFIFLLGWVSLIWSLPIAIASILGILVILRAHFASPVKQRWEQSTEVLPIGASAVVTALILAAIMTFLTGHGKLMPEQVWDWEKHNAILLHLVEDPWPVWLSIDGVETPLVYYIAYYLVPGAFGKIAGLQLAHISLFFWGTIGLALTLLWISTLCGSGRVWPMLLFLCFSGLDLVGMLLLQVDPRVHFEFWALHWQYSNVITQWHWVPQHALGGWLITSLLIYSSGSRSLLPLIALLCTVALLWSPFVAIGLAPFGLFCLLHGMSRDLRHWIKSPILWGIVALTLLWMLVLVSYFASLEAFHNASSTGQSQAINRGWIWASLKYPDTTTGLITKYVAFVFCEAIFYSFIIWYFTNQTETAKRSCLLIATIVLVFIPLYRLGSMNDFAMRSSIPGLFILALLIITVVRNLQKPTMRVLLVYSLVAQSIYPISFVWSRVNLLPAPYMENHGRVVQETKTLQPSFAENPHLLVQYLGHNDTFFWKNLAPSHQDSPK